MPAQKRRKDGGAKYSEEELQNSLDDVSENGISLYAAEQKWGVPRRTLKSRLDDPDRQPQDAQIQPAARLSMKQEKIIVEWILKQESLGYSPPAVVVRAIVCSILEGMGDTRPLRKGWITSFKKRQPQIATKIGKKQEASRFTAFTPKAVN